MNEIIKLQKQHRTFTFSIAVVCALLVIVSRYYTSTVYQVCEFGFAFTDAFIIFASGTGGLGCGLLSFTLIFSVEFLRISDYAILYALSTYLIVVLVSYLLSYKGYYRNWLKASFSALLLSCLLALCWKLTFSLIVSDISLVEYYANLPYMSLLYSALPECFAASFSVAAFFRFAPEKVKKMSWAYVKAMQNENIHRQLGLKITALSLWEAFSLSLVAIFVTGIFEAGTGEEIFSLDFIFSGWRAALRLGLLMMSTAVPIAYIFNLFIIHHVVRPVNAMSFFMDRYFDMDEESRAAQLPDLNIHTGDEVEKLYLSLQKMVGDMRCYINKALEGERKSAHLTQGFMLALAKAVDAKDTYTNGHSVRVAEYAKEIARRAGKSQREQDEIYMMGLLHDIGKIGVPESIINKTGKLTDEEFAIIKTHPAMGYEILRNVKELPTLAMGARWHHERYDGKGYPDGLKNFSIPEEARIIAVADAYDAMASKRSYRDVMSQEKVREQIENGKGSQFDPRFADIMLEMIDGDKEYRMRENADEI